MITVLRIHAKRNTLATLLSLSLASLVLLHGGAAYGFGTTESLGQNSEHQHLTESIKVADPSWGSNSVALLAGNKGNYGGVGAADRVTDSSSTPLVGLGPGFKHCDDGDYLAISGYPQSKSAAENEIEKCARYYQTLMNRAVRYAGNLVSPEMKVNEGVFTMTSKSSIKPDNVCQYRFSLAPDKNSKCDVINAFGRALHVAEDVWSHSNWADLADPTRTTSISNPPGLGRTDIPGFLRYPAAVIEVPDGFISGCDDSVPVIGPDACKGRVTHGVLAKDNGTIDVNGDGSTDTSTKKYVRGTVTVDGKTNFQRATTGARAQVASSWADLKAAIVDKYGDERGQAIISVITSDSPKALPAQAKLVEGSLMSTQNQGATGEFSADPSDDAPLGAGDKTTDSGHAALESESEGGTDRRAAAASSDETDSTGTSTASGQQESADNNSSVVWLIGGIAVVLIAVAAFAFIRIRRRTN